MKGGDCMKRILWLSRHTMTPDQYKDLQRIYGDITLTQWPYTLEDITQVDEQVAQSDVIAAVLPTELLSQLVSRAEGKPVICAKSNRILSTPSKSSGTPEPQVTFVHSAWQEIQSLELVLKTL